MENRLALDFLPSVPQVIGTRCGSVLVHLFHSSLCCPNCVGVDRVGHTPCKICVATKQWYNLVNTDLVSNDEKDLRHVAQDNRVHLEGLIQIVPFSIGFPKSHLFCISGQFL